MHHRWIGGGLIEQMNYQVKFTFNAARLHQVLLRVLFDLGSRVRRIVLRGGEKCFRCTFTHGWVGPG